jgi:adenine/guanine phosphoribosyltransferase-like PRPP-binding protein
MSDRPEPIYRLVEKWLEAANDWPDFQECAIVDDFIKTNSMILGIDAAIAQLTGGK